MVRLHQPITKHVLDFSAVREGEWPEVPSPTQHSPDRQLLSTYVSNMSVPIGDATNQEYKVQGSYVYVDKMASNYEQSGMPAMTNPAITKAAEVQRVPASSFIGTLVEKGTKKDNLNFSTLTISF